MKIRPVWRIFAFCLSITALLPCIAEADLVAEWRFEEGTADSVASGALSVLDTSGNNLHGTPLNGPIYRSVPYGGLGLDFDGVNDRVTIADDPLFHITKSLTLEATVRLDAPAGVNQTIIQRRDDQPVGPVPYQIKVLKDGLAQFSFDTGETRVALKSPDSVPLGEFFHLAGTLDDTTGVMKLFIDGEVVAELTTDLRPLGELDSNLNPGVGIGAWATSEIQLFDGIIDEVRIWDEARAIPEPSTITLFTMAGLVGAFVAWRKRKRT